MVASVSDKAALIDVKQVAAMLSCSWRHVYRLADGGKMPKPLQLGSLNRWPREALNTWIAEGCKPIRRK